MSIRIRRLTLAGTVALLLGAALLVVFEQDAPKVSAADLAPSSAVVNHYSVFARTANSSAALPAPAATLASSEGTGSTLIRALPASGTYAMWATLTGDTLCAVLGPESGTANVDRVCDSGNFLEEHHELLAQESLVDSSSPKPPPAGLANVISGLAPDGVTQVTLEFTDDTTTTVPVVDNRFIDILESPKTLQQLTWTGPSGTTYHGQ